MKQIIFLFLSLVVSFCSIGQKTFHLIVNVDTTIDTKKLHIFCENGMNSIYPTDSFKNNSLSMSGKYYSKYVTVHVDYDASSDAFYHVFWITDKKATINLKTITGDSFGDRKLVNAIDINKVNKELLDNLKNYTMEELNNMSALWKNSGQYKNRATFDSIQKGIFISMIEKSSEYIKKHNNDYFYFWYFTDQYYQVSKTLFAKDTSLRLTIRDSLISIFPKKFISSFEGENILREIEVFLRPKINIPTPLFKVKDINGTVLDIKQYRGKYVLLDFWASWCPPCMRSMPLLKEIRQKYPVEKLSIIGVNYDRDSTAFTNAVRKEQLNWDQVFDKDDVMMKLFGQTPLPTWILINEEGIVTFNESGSDKMDKLIKLLEAL